MVFNGGIGTRSNRVKAKILLQGRAPSSRPCSQRQARDLPPESAPRSDWLVSVYAPSPTNQILRFSFQLLKGRRKQAQMTPQQHRQFTGGVISFNDGHLTELEI